MKNGLSILAWDGLTCLYIPHTAAWSQTSKLLSSRITSTIFPSSVLSAPFTNRKVAEAISCKNAQLIVRHSRLDMWPTTRHLLCSPTVWRNEWWIMLQIISIVALLHRLARPSMLSHIGSVLVTLPITRDVVAEGLSIARPDLTFHTTLEIIMMLKQFYWWCMTPFNRRVQLCVLQIAIWKENHRVHLKETRVQDINPQQWGWELDCNIHLILCLPIMTDIAALPETLLILSDVYAQCSISSKNLCGTNVYSIENFKNYL